MKLCWCRISRSSSTTSECRGMKVHKGKRVATACTIVPLHLGARQQKFFPCERYNDNHYPTIASFLLPSTKAFFSRFSEHDCLSAALVGCCAIEGGHAESEFFQGKPLNLFHLPSKRITLPPSSSSPPQPPSPFASFDSSASNIKLLRG